MMGCLRGFRALSWAAVGLLVALAHSPTAQAQITDPPITGFVKQYEMAFQQCDAAALEKMLSERFTGFGVRGSLAKGPDVATLRKQCADGYTFALNFAPIHADSIGSHHWLVVGTAAGHITTRDGKSVPTSLKFSWLLTKEADRMVVLHSHLSQRN